MAEGQGVACRAMVPDDAAVQRVVLQPSTAWGDGGHPTTRMIIQFLNSSDLQQVSVLDYGCVGSPYNAVNMITMSVKHTKYEVVHCAGVAQGSWYEALASVSCTHADSNLCYNFPRLLRGNWTCVNVASYAESSQVCVCVCVSLQGITAALLGASKLVRIPFYEFPFCVVYCESAVQWRLIYHCLESLLGVFCRWVWTLTLLQSVQASRMRS